MKKIIFMLLLVSLMLLGCAPAEEQAQLSGQTIKTGYQYWPGEYWVEIADRKGWFEEAGLNVELAFNANIDFQGSQEAMANGELDAHQLVLFDFLRYISEGKDLVAVVNTDNSDGGDGIVARKEIKSVIGLKGKKIGVDKSSFLEFILAEALEGNGLTLDDVAIVQANAEDFDMLKSGEVDALASWEPTLSRAVEELGANMIFDTSLVPGLVPDVLTFHRSFVNERPEDVQAYVNVWHKTTKFIKENPDEAYGIIADIYDVPVEEVAAFAEKDKILDLADNKIAFSYAAGFESLHGTARQINDFMKANGITNKTMDSTEFIDARFIRNIG